MRFALAALAIVWLAVVGWAFESGRRAESEYRAAVEALAAEDDGAGVAIGRYERGLFSSQVTTLVGPRELADGESSLVRLVLHQRIAHGPYPWAWVSSDEFDGRPIVAWVDATPTLELEDEQTIEEIPLPLALQGFFTRADGATLRLGLDPEAGSLHDPELSADWAGIGAGIEFAYDGSAASGGFTVPRLAFDGDSSHLRIEGFTSEFDLARAAGPADVYVGRSRLRLGLLEIGGPKGTFSLRDLDVENASDVSQGAWSLQVDGSLGGVHGPDGRLGSGELVLHIGGIAVEPMAELESVGAALEADGPDGEAIKAELMGAAAALWPQMMAAGPEIELSRLRIETPDGEIRMAFRAAVDTSEPMLLANPLMTFPALEIDLELSLPRPVLEGWLAAPRPIADDGGQPAPWVLPAETASQRVETWIERGHLGRHDGAYVTSVRVRQGTIRMNGRVVSFDAL